mmetsp:Transcript_63123/g.137200  ORF Transcript_63123/g.137200 Transcript_63123/m.137200 type:complete len:80 (+) Transcript_63123:428-667(+)
MELMEPREALKVPIDLGEPWFGLPGDVIMSDALRARAGTWYIVGEATRLAARAIGGIARKLEHGPEEALTDPEEAEPTE